MTFHRFRPWLGAAGVAIMLAGLTPATAKVLAKVDGQEVTDDDVKQALEDIGATLPAQLQGAEREAYVVDYLIDMILVARKADADKLGEGAEFQRRLAYMRQRALMETLFGNLGKEAATDAALKAVYDQAAKAQASEPEIKARHILVATEAEAKVALKRVRDGEDFGKVATEVSRDPGSQGGDLGWFTKDQMVPEFANAAFAMEPNQISEPVKSQFGWHIIKVEEKRSKSFPPFDQVKDQVKQYVVQRAQQDLIMKLRSAAKIERMDAPAKPDAKPEVKPEPAKPEQPKK